MNNTACNKRPIWEERRKNKKQKVSPLRHSRRENKTQPIEKGCEKIQFCRVSERKLTDQQCWSNENGLETEELDGFHALIHVNSMPISHRIKVSEEGVGMSIEGERKRENSDDDDERALASYTCGLSKGINICIYRDPIPVTVYNYEWGNLNGGDMGTQAIRKIIYILLDRDDIY
ncbi:hypothetical protein VNO77_04625 [Canavalia gladiata]|uniref:Uncharacterized protein n=1 Tax=Canavalia gladiata TaxID=3824 RepID=A0AAN9R988_CANGL